MSDRRSIFDDMAVDVPEGTLGRCTVERFTVERDSLANLRLAFQGRACQPGEYTRMLRDGYLWMSDTTAERYDHLEPAYQIRRGADSVLIGGLGLGMILRVALLTDTVKRVDVVEVDPDVIGLIGPHYEKLAADRGIDLTLTEADVFEVKPAPGSRWDVAWFDVWADVSPDDLGAMQSLRRRYARRTGWCDCWARLDMLRMRRRYARSGW